MTEGSTARTVPVGGSAAGADPEMTDRSGEVLDGRYLLSRLLGEGGMGQVYEGQHLVTGRKVAVKLLLPQLSDNRDAVKRFYREARAAAAIGSEHICEVLDMRPPEAGAPFLVMEFLEGETLADRLARGRMDLPEAVEVLGQVLDGLSAAHQVGIVHRDIKPDNVFLEAREGAPPRVKLLDFGISKVQAGADDSLSLTRAGTVLGTPQYMSPEQARGDTDIGPAADLYAVGVILYEALTGRLPFDADSFSAIVVQIVMGTAEDPATIRPDLPPHAAEATLRSISREPEDRFGSAVEMASALRGLAGAPEEAAPSVAAGLAAPPSGKAPAARAGSISRSTRTPMGWEGDAPRPRRARLAVALGVAIVAAGVAAALGVPRLLGGRTTVLEVTRVEVPAAPSPPPRPAPPPPAPRTAHVILAVEPQTASLVLDGEPLEGNPVEVGLPADGADHELRASAEGFVAGSRTFRAEEGGEVLLTLDPVAPAPRPVARPPRVPTPGPAGRGQATTPAEESRPRPTPSGEVSPVQDPWATGG